MSGLPRHDYERLPRTSLEAQDLPELKRSVSASSWLSTISSRLPGVKTLSERATYTHLVTPRRRKRSILRAIYYTVFAFPYFCAFLVLVAVFFAKLKYLINYNTLLHNVHNFKSSPVITV